MLEFPKTTQTWRLEERSRTEEKKKGTCLPNMPRCQSRVSQSWARRGCVAKVRDCHVEGDEWINRSISKNPTPKEGIDGPKKGALPTKNVFVSHIKLSIENSHCTYTIPKMKFVTFLLALAYTATVAMASDTKECEGVYFFKTTCLFIGRKSLGLGLEDDRQNAFIIQQCWLTVNGLKKVSFFIRSYFVVKASAHVGGLIGRKL